MPIAPPAPARFSMTTGCLSAAPSASATGLATVSATPPGGNGTIIVTGRSGYCATAALADVAATSASASIRRIRIAPPAFRRAHQRAGAFSSSLAVQKASAASGDEETAARHLLHREKNQAIVLLGAALAAIARNDRKRQAPCAESCARAFLHHAADARDSVAAHVTAASGARTLRSRGAAARCASRRRGASRGNPESRPFRGACPSP